MQGQFILPCPFVFFWTIDPHKCCGKHLRRIDCPFLFPDHSLIPNNMHSIYRHFLLILCICSILSIGHLAFAETISVSSETGATIVLKSGWNTFSTPKVLDSMSFQSWGIGLFFYGLTSTWWQVVVPDSHTIKPLDGYLINNINLDDSSIRLSYKTWLSPMDMIFQKSLHAGWNLIWITTLINPFSTIGTNASMSVDFTTTSDASTNKLNGVTQSFYPSMTAILPWFQNHESYGVFLSASGLYAWIQSQAGRDTVLWEVVYEKWTLGDKFSSLGASNIILYKSRITSSVPLTIRGLRIIPTITNIQTGSSYSGVYAFANNTLSIRANWVEISTIDSSDQINMLTNTPLSIKNIVLPIVTWTPSEITIVASSLRYNADTPTVYTFAVALTDVRDSSNNSVSLVTSSVTGDKTIVETPTILLKNSTVAAPSTSTLSSQNAQEIGRFGLEARSDKVRVTKIVMNATGASILNVADAASIELVRVADGSKVSATTSLYGQQITFDSINGLEVDQDTTQNFFVRLSSVKSLDLLYGQTLALTLSAVNITGNAVNSSAALVVSGTAAPKTYTIGVVPPTVKVTANSPLTQNAKISTVRFTNADSNTGIVLSGVTLSFQSRSTAQGSFTFSGTICLRDLGSNNSCGGLNTTVGQATSQAGGTYTFTFAGLTINGDVLSKNGGSREFEVYVDNAPLWVAGDNANVTVKTLNYTVGASSPTESYVGITDASATAIK